MITSININNANRYSILFEEVSEKLNEAASSNEKHPYKELYNKLLEGKNNKLGYGLFWNEAGKIEINSLELYFGIIEELVKIKPNYGILPLISNEASDEPYFEINANTRAINVPRNFSVQVQGDEQAETIYFQIDRYFDATDLYNQDIYIQWELPAGIGEEKKRGFSRPWIVDVESKPGFIIFGWALSSKVTSKNGDVKFSVKFLKKEGNNITYSLNTLPATLTIRQGLVLDLDEAIQDTSTLRFQNGAIEGTLSASKPIISEDLDSSSYYFIDSSAADYELQISAVSPDAGSLSATWYKSETEFGENISSGEKSSIKVKGYTITKTSTGDLMIDNSYKLDENFIDNHACYLTNNGGQLTDRVSDLQMIHDKFLTSETVSIYIPFYTYNVKEPGYYYCSVINRVGLQSSNTRSETAYFPSPIPPLPSHNGTKREGYIKNETTLIDYSKIDNSNDINIIENTQYIYQWSRLNEESKKYENVVDGTNNSYTVPSIGTYKCSVKSLLNKQSTEPAIENIWKVVNAPSLNISINDFSAANYTDRAEPLYLPIGQTTTVKINNMSSYDKVSYTVNKIDRATGNNIGLAVTSGDLFSEDDNLFTFISVDGQCKITCKGYVGSSTVVETADFIFYTEVSSSNS